MLASCLVSSLPDSASCHVGLFSYLPFPVSFFSVLYHICILMKHCSPQNFTGDLVLGFALYICCRQINRLCGVRKSILLVQPA